MCLTIHSGPHSAKSQFHVFKYVYLHNDGETFHTPYQGFLWQLNRLMSAVIERIPSRTEKGKGTVENGIHAYTHEYEKEITLRINVGTFSDQIFTESCSAILLCQIPQSAKFYLGTSGDIVSSQLMPMKCLINAIDVEKDGLSFDEAFLKAYRIAINEKYNLIPMK